MAEKKAVTKKAVTKVQQPTIRVLAAVPACHTSHVQYRKQVVDAIKTNFPNNPNVDVTLDVCEESDNLVETENNWDSVVAKFNALAERIVAEGFDYLWLIEADVVIPYDALEHLLSDNADVACGVVPYHFQNYLCDHYENGVFVKGVAGGEIYRDLACTGYFLPDKQGKPTFDIVNLYIKNVKDKVLVGSPEHMIFNGTGCILIKRGVFDSGLRWRWDNKVCGFDVYFWQDAQRQGSKCVTDGFVICQHLGK
jgi:hypothetical protein